MEEELSTTCLAAADAFKSFETWGLFRESSETFQARRKAIFS